MQFDVSLLSKNLLSAKGERTVPTDEVNAYLLEKVIWPLRRGEKLRYGQVDFSAFDIDDLRVAADYTEKCDRVSGGLETLMESIILADAMPCRKRAFC